MKRTLFLTLTLASLTLGACAHASHDAAPHDAAPPALGGPAARQVDLPGAPGAGEPREVKVLVDEPALKLVTITLRGGTVLDTHHTAVPVTITALQGSGTVVAGAERLRLDATHAVVLAPGVPHAVEPDAGTDLVLLVHHLGRGPAHDH
jgi:quercetin dioxygenase-like cupin family protein